MAGDPINRFDLDGNVCFKYLRRRAVRLARGVGETIAIAGTAAVATAACAGNPLCGVAAGAALGSAFGALNHALDNKQGSVWGSAGLGALKGGAVGGIASFSLAASGEALTPLRFATRTFAPLGDRLAASRLGSWLLERVL